MAASLGFAKSMARDEMTSRPYNSRHLLNHDNWVVQCDRASKSGPRRAGPGGTGKTRLAIQAAAAADEFMTSTSSRPRPRNSVGDRAERRAAGERAETAGELSFLGTEQVDSHLPIHPKRGCSILDPAIFYGPVSVCPEMQTRGVEVWTTKPPAVAEAGLGRSAMRRFPLPHLDSEEAADPRCDNLRLISAGPTYSDGRQRAAI